MGLLAFLISGEFVKPLYEIVPLGLQRSQLALEGAHRLLTLTEGLLKLDLHLVFLFCQLLERVLEVSHVLFRLKLLLAQCLLESLEFSLEVYLSLVVLLLLMSELRVKLLRQVLHPLRLLLPIAP